MKPMDYVLMAGVLLIAVGVLVYNTINFGHPLTESAQVVLHIDGQFVDTYPLMIDGTYDIDDLEKGHYNVLEIKDQVVSMVEANCHDEICVRTRPINKSGQSIVCMPHRVVIEIDGSGQVEESEVDDISR